MVSKNGFNSAYRMLNEDQQKAFREGVARRLNWLPATHNHKKHGRRAMTEAEAAVVTDELQKAINQNPMKTHENRNKF